MIVRSWRLAVGTTTIVPSGDVGDIDRRTACAAMLLAPVSVMVVAAPAVAVGWLAAYAGTPDVVAGALVVAALAYGTRAMHLDGLADTVDGLGGGWTRERALEIMRRGDVGPMGAVALLLCLVIQAAAFGALVADGARGAVVTVGAVVCSRGAIAAACWRGIPAARPDGLGAAVARSVPGALLAVQALLGVAALTAATWWWQASGPGQWWIGPAAWTAAAAAVTLLLRRAVRRLGGVTGDVIGAGVEVALTAAVVVLSAGAA